MTRRQPRGLQKRVLVCDDCGVGYSHPGKASRYCRDCRPNHSRLTRGAAPKVIPDGWYDQAARWVAGESLEAIAAGEGVTREAVRLRITHLLPRRTIQALRQARKAEMAVRSGRTLVDGHLRVAVARFKICSVCGVEYRTQSGWKDARWSFCPDHKRYRSQLMLTCEDGRHENHKMLIHRAKYGDVNGPQYDNAVWRTRQANGTDRHLVAGSAMHGLILEAQANGWPLWDRLPVKIREWVERGGASTRQERTCIGCGIVHRGKGKSFCSHACYLANQRKRADR